MNKHIEIGRKIYYDKSTGEILVSVGERSGFVRETTVEEDIATFKVLSERNRETFDYIQLEYGQYSQDFMECNGYRVNIEKLAELPDDRKHEALEFTYPDPNQEEPPEEPIYQPPLSEVVIRNTEYLIDVDFRLSLVELGLI